MYSYFSRQDYAIFGLISRSKSRVRIHSPSAKITLLRKCALRAQLPTKDNLRSRAPEARAEKIWWFLSFSSQKYVKLSLVRQLKSRVRIKLPPPLLVSLSKNHPLRKAHFGCASEPRTTNVRERGRHELRKIWGFLSFSRWNTPYSGS